MKTTLHQQIITDIERRIVSGDWPPGFRLPFEIELAKSYHVSRMTVNKVLTKLAQAGLIERRRKKGSFVAQPQTQAAILEIHDIETEVRQMPATYHYELLQTRISKAAHGDKIYFAEQTDGLILELSCLHFANDTPFCYETRAINLDCVPQAEQVDFVHMPPGRWLQTQVPWNKAEHKISAMAANTHLAKILMIQKGAPCLKIERRTWNEQGAVTFAHFDYPAEKHAVIARFTPASSIP